MPGNAQLSGKDKHSLINGDIIIVLGIAFGLLLSGSLFSRTSKYPKQGVYETEIISPGPQNPQTGLQLETFNVRKCINNTALDFLIDNSGSMQFGSKMTNLKGALTTFANNFSPSGAIALQTYSETVKERIPFSLFQTSKDQFIKEVNSMQPLTATHSKDAFLVAQKSLTEGAAKFPDHKFSLVFISDGIPETAVDNNACVGGIGSEYCMEHPRAPGECRCWSTPQDPREVATQIKNSGVRIFTISYTDTFADSQLQSKLTQLMNDVASSPADHFPAPADSELTGIISQIANRICTE